MLCIKLVVREEVVEEIVRRAELFVKIMVDLCSVPPAFHFSSCCKAENQYQVLFKERIPLMTFAADRRLECKLR